MAATISMAIATTLAFAPAKAEGEASGSASISTSSSASAEGDASGSSDDRPMRKWAPERNMWEIGIWLGLLVPNLDHEWYDPRVISQSPYKRVAFDLGFRLGYYPLRWLGGEFEVGVMPTSLDAGGRATMYAIRGHVIGQLPWWRLTPFLVVGGGGHGVGSDDGVAGDDIDASFHWGPGLKFYATRYLALRLDLRHLVGARVVANNGAASHFEALFGISLTLGRKKGEDAGDDDPDGDGFKGSDDKCPDQAGIYPDGCPDSDTDGDGVADSVDECPEEPGPAPTGCPGAEPDRDADGIPDESDICIDDPETANGYEDDDGCPDEVPKKLRGVTGKMDGITFETNSAKITPESKATLDDAVKTLEANPRYDVEIVGHTDDTGDHDYNVRLSQRRADSVKQYLVSHGVERERVEARGAGPDEPMAKNDTPEGRAQNRRIEFKVRRRFGSRREERRQKRQEKNQ
jgi:outer membrane protein OmpA-like peptidoglycan-associated protein